VETWTPDDLKRHLDKGDAVFLKLWKKGCGICKLSIPATDRMEKDNKHGLIFGKIDTAEFPEMLNISDTEVLPAFFVFVSQQKKGQFTGFKGLKKLEEFVDGAVAS